MRSMNFTYDNTKKKCAGRDCERIGTRILKVRFLNKVGIFCELCANRLLAEDLAVAEVGA
jgi:hypothetical protein